MATEEKDPKPLTREELRMVGEFRKYRDIYRAAEKAHVPKNQAVRVFHKPAFQEELDRQDEAVRQERAVQEVRVEALTNELVDLELARMVVLDAKEHGNLKLDAIRMALVVAGRIQNGSMRSLDPTLHRAESGGEPPPGPTFIYQAQVTQNLTAAEAEPIMPAAGVAPATMPKPAPPAPAAAAAASPATGKPSVRRAGPLKVE